MERKNEILQTLKELNIHATNIEEFERNFKIQVEELQIPKEKLIQLSRKLKLAEPAKFFDFYPGENSGIIILSKKIEPSNSGINLGFDNLQNPINLNFYNQSTHTLIGGSTGAGKSNLLNHLISQLATNPDWNIFILDLKGQDFNCWKSNKNIYTTNQLPEFESWLESGKKNPSKLKFYIVDELAELNLNKNEKFKLQLASALQIGRSFGIRIILSTQRPSVDVIPGTLKINIDTRICLRVPSSVDSRIILDQTGAEKLIERGEFLAKIPEVGLTKGKAPKANIPKVETPKEQPKKAEPKIQEQPKIDPLKLKQYEFYKSIFGPYLDPIIHLAKQPIGYLAKLEPTYPLFVKIALRPFLSSDYTFIANKFPSSTNYQIEFRKHIEQKNSIQNLIALLILNDSLRQYGLSKFKQIESEILLNGYQVGINYSISQENTKIEITFKKPEFLKLKKYLAFGLTTYIYLAKKESRYCNKIKDFFPDNMEKIYFTEWTNLTEKDKKIIKQIGPFVYNINDPKIKTENMTFELKDLSTELPENLYKILIYKLYNKIFEKDPFEIETLIRGQHIYTICDKIAEIAKILSTDNELEINTYLMKEKRGILSQQIEYLKAKTESIKRRLI